MANQLHDQLEKQLEQRLKRRASKKPKMKVSGRGVIKLKQLIHKKSALRH